MTNNPFYSIHGLLRSYKNDEVKNQDSGAGTSGITGAGFLSGGYLSSLYNNAFGPSTVKQEVEKKPGAAAKPTSFKPAEKAHPKLESSKPGENQNKNKPTDQSSYFPVTEYFSSLYNKALGPSKIKQEYKKNDQSDAAAKPTSSKPAEKARPKPESKKPDDKQNKNKPTDQSSYTPVAAFFSSLYSSAFGPAENKQVKKQSTPVVKAESSKPAKLTDDNILPLWSGPPLKAYSVQNRNIRCKCGGPYQNVEDTAERGPIQYRSVPAKTPEEESRLSKAIKNWVPLIALPISLLALLGIIYYIFKILHGYLVTTNFHIYEAFVGFLSLLQSVEMRSLLGMSDNKSSETGTQEPVDNEPAKVEVTEIASEESPQNPQNWKYFGRYRSPGILRILDRNDLGPCDDDDCENRYSGISGSIRMFGNKASSKTNFNTATSSKTSKCESGEESNGEKSSNNKSD